MTSKFTANLDNTSLFILNNNGYGSIRQSQASYFKYKAGCDASSNLNFPIWGEVAALFGFNYEKVESMEKLRDIRDSIQKPFGFSIYDLVVPENENRGPKLKTILDGDRIYTQPLGTLEW